MNEEVVMKLTLTADIENALIEEANKQGTTPEILALDYLRKRFIPSEMVNPPKMKGELS